MDDLLPAGCICAAIIDDESAPRRARWLGLLGLALLAWLAALLRYELAMLGAPAVALGVARLLGWGPAMRRATHAAGRGLLAIVGGPLPIFLVFVAALVAIDALPRMGKLTYGLAAVAPLNLSFLPMLRTLGIFLPFGLGALFVLGVIHGVRRSLTFLLLPVMLARSPYELVMSHNRRVSDAAPPGPRNRRSGVYPLA